MDTDRKAYKLVGEFMDDLNKILKAFEEKQRKCCEVKKDEL